MTKNWSPSRTTIHSHIRTLLQRNDGSGFLVDPDGTAMSESLTASMTVADVLLKRPLAARILVQHRMHCVGCTIASFETLRDACEIYGVSLVDLLAELNATTKERPGP
jgi:hybrid cluster-associated redox disulfide protein